jgi:hypothetical protein
VTRKHAEKRSEESWFGKVGSYPILGVPVKIWLGILLSLAFIGVFVFLEDRQRQEPSVSETVIAEISNLFVWRDEESGVESHSLTFKRDGKEFRCRVASPFLLQRWHQLKIGQRYELVMVRRGNRCYIDSAVEADEP